MSDPTNARPPYSYSVLASAKSSPLRTEQRAQIVPTPRLDRRYQLGVLGGDELRGQPAGREMGLGLRDHFRIRPGVRSDYSLNRGGLTGLCIGRCRSVRVLGSTSSDCTPPRAHTSPGTRGCCLSASPSSLGSPASLSKAPNSRLCVYAMHASLEA